MSGYHSSAGIDLLSLIPKCGSCLEDFDTFLHAPQILPCCHTFCLMCISKDKQRKKRRCAICKEKYSKFLVNSAYLVLIARVHAQRRSDERVSARCEECNRRLPVMCLRRCATCEAEIQKIVKHSRQTCCVCLECCVDSHNGHELQRIVSPRSRNSERSNNRDAAKIAQANLPRHNVFVRRGNPTLGHLDVSATFSPAGSQTSIPKPKSNGFKRPDNLAQKNITQTFRMGVVLESLKTTKTTDHVQLPGEQREASARSPTRNNKLGYLENAEYFGGVESGFSSSVGSSIGAVSSASSANDVATSPSQFLYCNLSAFDKRNNSCPQHGYVPNMPRKNKHRGGPCHMKALSLDEEYVKMDDNLLPIVARSSAMRKYPGDVSSVKTGDTENDEDTLTMTPLRITRFSARERREGVRSEGPLQKEESKAATYAKHDYENVFQSAENICALVNV